MKIFLLNRIRILILFCSILCSGSSFALDKVLSLDELNKQKIYYLSAQSNKNGIDVNKVNKKVYRLCIQKEFSDLILIKAINFPNLQELQIDGDYSHFPIEAFEFKNLQVLKLNLCNSDACEHTNLITLSDGLYDLANLKVLEVKGISGLIYIPEKISKLSKLLYIKLEAYLGPVILPVSIAYLPQLRYLNISEPCNFDVITEDQRHNSVFSNDLCDNLEEKDFIKSQHINIESDLVMGPNNLHDFSNSNLKPVEKKISDSFSNGNKSITGQLDSLNQPDGNWNFYYNNGKLKEERFYRSGKETGIWSIYDSYGTKLISLSFESVLTRFVWFYANGKIRKESFFKNNMADGIWKTYYETGIVSSEFSYSNDLLNGPVRFYYNNTGGTQIVSYEANYQNGKINGKEIYRDSTNTIQRINLYTNGILIEK
ncbi:MAG: variant repeat protein [Bacteroidetes bacterium]|nr:variant repeat protein [Bacteroidota bacterium]